MKGDLLRKFSVFILLIVCSYELSAQSVSVCEGENFDLAAYFSDELAACAPGAAIEITSATAGGVPSGPPPDPLIITSDGSISVNILSGGSICESLNVQVDLIEANFTATAVQGSCHIVDITGPENEPGCTYTYTIEGNTYTVADLPNFAFSNGGLQDISLDVSCNGCSASQNLTLDVDGPIADLDFTSPESIYYDDNFESIVVCTDLAVADLTITDISQQISGIGTSGTVEVVAPDNTTSSVTVYPDPATISLTQEGLYTFSYTLIDNGCTSAVSYDLFVSNPNVSTDLEVPVTVTPFTCEDNFYDLNVCPGGCPTNPSGTVYTVELDCTGFIYQTTEVPFTVPVPLDVASCGNTCTSGGTSTLCACELIVRAARPCVNEISNAICPFQIQPQPDAEFDIIPNQSDDSYCINESLIFEPDWDNLDCNGPNPTPSICEIQNPEWSISPATGFINLSGDLQTYPLNIQFTTPGTYNVCFEWENACGSDSYCRTICVIDDTPPVVTWNNSTTICVGDAVMPEVTFNSVPCSSEEITWAATSTQVSISDNSANTPAISFATAGNYTVNVDVEGLCAPFSASANYTVCDVPQLAISNSTPTLCVGQEFCFENLASANWNNCPGDIIWTIPGVTGSPFTNPSGTDLCLTFATAQTFDITLEATNICGTDIEMISITIDQSPSCPIEEPGDFCPGSTVNIQPPAGASNPVWFASTDGITFNPLPGGMPTNPLETTYFYVESQVNGCFCISDTVVANFFTEPDFTINASNTNPCPGNEVVFQLSPPQGDVNWYDGLTLIATQPALTLQASSPLNITAELIYGSAAVPCSVSETISVNPITNPVSIDCSSLPSTWCAGDDAAPLPSIAPAGGSAFITDGTNILLANPTEIDPTILGTGDYYFVYEVTGWGASNCTFSDSCSFSIINPQIPVINPVPDTLCYYSTIQFSETTGLSGSWSSTCPSAISSTGFFDPEDAGCLPGDNVEVIFGGQCIQNDTLLIHLIPTPPISVVVSNTNPCPGDTVNFSVNPVQPNINWLDNDGNLVSSDPVLNLEIVEETTITAQLIYGTENAQCEVLASATIAPEINPISIDCNALPAVWCSGDEAVALPAISPAGGVSLIRSPTEIIEQNPTDIDPTELGTGTFYLVYELEGWGTGGCTFRDSCIFSIIEPQVPAITPQLDSLCYNETIQFTETTGLTGTWSASCSDAINSDGDFTPQAADCFPGSTVEIVYSGECIDNDTLAIFLIPVPTVQINMPLTNVCTNDCLDLDATIDGDFDEANWELTWIGGTATIPFGESFCPETYGITTSIEVVAELTVSVNESPICLVKKSIEITTTGLPDESFVLESPQCIAAGVSLPECASCESYSIVFENNTGMDYPCSVPGDGCMLPDTGFYSYNVVFDFGFCQSDTLVGDLHIIDEPYLEITNLSYDSCAPVAFYELTYGGFDHSVIWQTDGDLINTNSNGNDLYTATINHINDIEVDAIYTDQITITNACGTISDSRTVYHKALPDFTLDPDSTFYCDGESVPVDIGFAQPLDVDSIVVSYFYEIQEELVLQAIPQELLYFNFDSEFDTLEVNFSVTAYNSCGSITKTLTAFVMPTDVSADMDIVLTPPVCVGDTIPITINSTGNANNATRQITSGNPFLDVFTTLGEWYLIPQEGIADGIYTIQLTENGNCGADMDFEDFTFGPSLSANFQANNACIGDGVNFIPLITEDANLIWTFAPDTSRNTDFPPPYFYEQPGTYFPSLFAESDGYCDDTFTRQIEIFEPRKPVLICDPDCEGSEGCLVNVDNKYVCVTVAEPDEFLSFDWRVRGRFSPSYNQTVRINVDQEMEPCGENIVTLIARDFNGCTSRVSKQIDFNDDIIYIPNSFTPNEDGFNDVFKPVIDSRIDTDLYELTIFNRWGQIVFQTIDPEESWRGNDISNENYYAESDVYTYIIKYKSCRNPNESDPQVLHGNITLIR